MPVAAFDLVYCSLSVLRFVCIPYLSCITYSTDYYQRLKFLEFHLIRKTDNLSYVSVSLTRTNGTFYWCFNIKVLTHFIIGVPFKPETLGVKKKPCGAFEVTWNPPTLDSGGGPLTGYQVQLKLTETGGWRNCTAFSLNHSCLFKDLRNKTRYQIRVRAFNKKGPGQWADTVETTDLIGKYSIIILLYYTKVMATLWYSTIITFLQLPFRFISTCFTSCNSAFFPYRYSLLFHNTCIHVHSFVFPTN